MRRVRNQPRAGWQEKVEAIGLTFHSADGQLYWDESAHYAFSAAEIDELEGAANAVHELCLKAAQHVIDGNLFHLLGIPAEIVPLIRSSWEREDFSLYGRFDFAFYPGMPPKLLEYNADTPTALVEAAIAQWYWLQDTHPDGDQFNSIHEQLIASWRRLAGERVHMGGVKDHLED